MRQLTVTQVLKATALLITACHASADPRAEYLLHCGGCHLEQGQGMPPEVPDLRIDVADFAASPEGRAYIVGVPGIAQSPLNDKGLAGVLNWMLATFYPGNDVAPFTVEEIQTLRAQPLRDPLRRRAELAVSLLRQTPGVTGAEHPLLP